MNSKLFLGLMILSLAAASAYGATMFLDTGERITGETAQGIDGSIIFKPNSAPPATQPQSDIRNISRNDSDFSLKLGVDLPGQDTESDDLSSTSYDITSGLTIAGEYTKYMNPTNVGVGYGVAYEIPRKFQDFKPQISFLPVYALIKLRTTPNANNEFFYFTGQLGYNEFFANNEYLIGGMVGGGLYLGAGIGAEFPLMNYTLLYTSNSGTWTSSGSTLNVVYTKLSFVIGVKI